MLVVGVGLGSIVAERSGQATLVNAALFAGVIAGGFVAGYGSRRSPLLAGTLASFPAAVAAVVVQLVRWAGDAGPVPLLGVALAVLLTASLGTLGGVLGRFRSPVRRSLYR
ncbi:MAG TPA: hypothetical protein DEP69_02680 [Acidimicrobiaceae bacterium]|nr:hypothetical protein [Acidimicrobiaceae bacterium]